MFSSTKCTRMLEKVTESNIKIIDIYKTKKKTFRISCDVKMSNGTIGQNPHYAIHQLTDNGFVLIFDNRTLDIPEVSITELDKPDELLEKIEDGFEKFKQFIEFVI